MQKANIPDETISGKLTHKYKDKIAVPIAEITTKNPIGNWSGMINSLFSLLKNLSSLNFVLLENFTISGMIIKPSINKPNIAIDHNPIANIRFQKLSLFILDLIKLVFGCSIKSANDFGTFTLFSFSTTGEIDTFRFSNFVKSCIKIILNFWSKIYSFSVPLFSTFSKGIKGIKAFILILFLSFSCNTTYAERVVGPAINNTSNKIKEAKQYKEYISEVEKQNHIPKGLLLAIAKVESSYNPHAVNIEGKPFLAPNKDKAIEAVKRAIGKGVTNIDLGIMQINYRWHKDSFTDVSEMLNPKVNIRYAGSLLADLYKKYGDWHTAIRSYHSTNPQHYRKYSKRIVMEWLEIS